MFVSGTADEGIPVQHESGDVGRDPAGDCNAGGAGSAPRNDVRHISTSIAAQDGFSSSQ